MSRKITREMLSRWQTELLNEAFSSTGTSSSSSLDPSAVAAAGVLAKLNRGAQSPSVCLQIIGDSTGTDLTEWFGVMSKKIAAKYTTHTLLWRPWNTTTQWFDPPQKVTTGTANGGVDRYATFAGAGQLQHAGSSQFPGSTSSQDFDIFAKIKPTDWKPGGAAAKRTLVARWQGAGSRSWAFFIDETGKLGFEWSADGTATSGTVLSTVAVPFTGSSTAWVRVQFDADNGASGNTATFYTGSDGVNWTTLGTAVTTATAATIFGGTILYSVGSRSNSTGADFYSGDIFWVEALNGLDTSTTRYSAIPPLLDTYDQSTTAASVSYGGAPVILALVGSASGQNTTYFDESLRKLRLNAAHGQDIVFLNSGHNETHLGFVATMLAWIASVRSRQQKTPLVMLSQNPTYYGTMFTSQAAVDLRYKRSAELMSAVAAGASAGVYPFDVYPAFANANLVDVLELDGLHPKAENGLGTSGSELWGNYVALKMFGVS